MNIVRLPPENCGLTICAEPTELKALTKCATFGNRVNRAATAACGKKKGSDLSKDGGLQGEVRAAKLGV
jgi:hypothetical protein